MDLETRHCCAHWNENTASSRLQQQHGTAPGGKHSGTLWLETRLPHEWVDGCLHSLGQTFPTSNDQGDYLPSGFAGRTRRCNSVERWTMDFGIVAYYSLPLRGCSGARRKVQLTASRQLLDWMRTRLSSWPSRVYTMAAGDLNSGIGRFRDGTYSEGVSVGEFHCAAQNEAGDTVVEMAIFWSSEHDVARRMTYVLWTGRSPQHH